MLDCDQCYLPTMRHLGRVSLPELEEERRPEGHEDGEDDSRVVVEEVHDLWVPFTCSYSLPIFEPPPRLSPSRSHKYRVHLRLSDLCWVDSDFGFSTILPTCSASFP